MEQNNANNLDTVAIFAEPGALSFCTRKEWKVMPECSLDELVQHETMLVVKGTDSVFFLLRNMNPFEWLNDTGNAFRLIKISVDEETGKQIFSIMNLSGAEAAQLMRNRLTLWE